MLPGVILSYSDIERGHTRTSHPELIEGLLTRDKKLHKYSDDIPSALTRYGLINIM